MEEMDSIYKNFEYKFLEELQEMFAVHLRNSNLAHKLANGVSENLLPQIKTILVKMYNKNDLQPRTISMNFEEIFNDLYLNIKLKIENAFSEYESLFPGLYDEISSEVYSMCYNHRDRLYEEFKGSYYEKEQRRKKKKEYQQDTYYYKAKKYKEILESYRDELLGIFNIELPDHMESHEIEKGFSFEDNSNNQFDVYDDVLICKIGNEYYGIRHTNKEIEIYTNHFKGKIKAIKFTANYVSIDGIRNDKNPYAFLKELEKYKYMPDLYNFILKLFNIEKIKEKIDKEKAFLINNKKLMEELYNLTITEPIFFNVPDGTLIYNDNSDIHNFFRVINNKILYMVDNIVLYLEPLEDGFNLNTKINNKDYNIYCSSKSIIINGISCKNKEQFMILLSGLQIVPSVYEYLLNESKKRQGIKSEESKIQEQNDIETKVIKEKAFIESNKTIIEDVFKITIAEPLIAILVQNDIVFKEYKEHPKLFRVINNQIRYEEGDVVYYLQPLKDGIIIIAVINNNKYVINCTAGSVTINGVNSNENKEQFMEQLSALQISQSVCDYIKMVSNIKPNIVEKEEIAPDEIKPIEYYNEGRKSNPLDNLTDEQLDEQIAFALKQLEACEKFDDERQKEYYLSMYNGLLEIKDNRGSGTPGL